MKKLLTFLAMVAMVAMFSATAFAQDNYTQPMPNQMNQQLPNITDALNQLGDAGTFNNVLERSGMGQTLNQGGPYTIFVPTDNALNSLPQDQRSELLNNPDVGRQAINNLVVQGEKMPSELQSVGTVQTLGGKQIQVTMQNNTLMVDGRQVTKAIKYNNGIVYLVDGMAPQQ